MDCVFDIGGITLRIDGAPWSQATMPRNFRPFLCSGEAQLAPCTTLRVVTYDAAPALPQGEPLSVSYNDLGQAFLYDGGSVWTILLVPHPGEQPRRMDMDKTLSHATLWLQPHDRYTDFVIDSMTRILFSQFAATCGALVIHASAVECNGTGYIFMGKSGTGKSTHSRLWIRNISGTALINDDCPMVIADESGSFLVCGTPWSGKTPCWQRTSAPVGGIVRLRQAPANRFIPLSGVDAFVAFIPGMSVMTSDRKLYAGASSTALRLLGQTRMAILECLPDREAAELCHRSLTEFTNLNHYT